MKEIRTLIVDDEVNGAKSLRSLLEVYCPDVKVIGLAHSAEQAKVIIQDHAPDLVFLDIEMPITNGFQLLAQLDNISFDVIFATAYEQFALQAFKTNALSYLLKPIDADDLQVAVEKYRQKNSDETLIRIKKLEEIVQNMTHQNSQLARIAVPSSEGLSYLDSSKIIRLEADSNYTHIFLEGGKKITSSRTLKEYEETLTSMNFFRIHNAHIVNLKFVDRYIKGEGGYVVTNDNTTLEVSRRRKTELLEALAKMK
jgi:two-component system LytT family response regulator